MKAIILAGGQGTRLRPVTYEIPKPLITVKKRPIVNHLLELFARHGVDDVRILVARDHQPDFERWKKNWESEFPMKNVELCFEETPRGTFGGLTMLKDWMGDEDFILSNGDELKDFDLTSLAAFHREHGRTGTIALVSVPNPSEYGVPIMDGGHIVEFLNKPADPPSHYVSSGLYILNPKIMELADEARESMMIEYDIFPVLAEKRQLMGYQMERGRWYDCGTLERWEKAIKEW